MAGGEDRRQSSEQKADLSLHKKMKISFAVAMLLQTSQSIRITDPKVEPKSWDPKTLQACPTDPARTILDDGKTHVAKYPFVGASCKL